MVACLSSIRVHTSADTDVLRARLDGLTIRDAHRLARKVDRLRRGGGPEAFERLDAEIATAEARIEARRAAVPAVSYPPELPVSARRDDLRAAIAEHQVVVVAGETGSGKTTQLPKICLELGRGVRGAIAHTQPRRLAARTVAERIADELDVQLGDAVGYSVRFNDRSGEDTLVRLMTDGLLLAETSSDRLLRRYDTIIVDEAHERSLNIDFLLGYLKRILPSRPDLKLVITSATIDPVRFAAHFGDAPVVEVSGRTYPVEVRHRPVDEETDQVEAIGDAVEELHREGPGDVLVFLSGEREIRDTADGLRGRLASDVEILPLYARLSTDEQHRVFRRPSGPYRSRVVLATNVAETSLTVPGIRYVVDPGTARISRYSARLKVQRLPIEPISQASADQRKGRCGRTADGICIRLYSEEDFEARPRFTDPEILRTSLASVLLQMAVAGLGAVEDFPFLDPPDRRQVRDAVTLLQELGAFGPESDAHRPGPEAGRAARRSADGADGPRGRCAGLRRRGHGHRGRAVDPGPARAPGGGSRGGRRAPRPLRRPGVGLPVALEPLELRPRAPARADRQPVPQAAEGGAPARPAHPRVAGPRRAAAPGGEGSRGAPQRDARRARRDPSRPAGGPAVARRAARSPPQGLPGCARRALRHLPRLGALAPPAGLGHGGRARGDVAAVGAHRGPDRPGLDRADGRAPRAAHVRRPVLGSEEGLGGGEGARDALRAADRRRPQGGLRAHRPGHVARGLHPQGARGARLADAPRVLRGQWEGAGGDRGAGGPRAAPRHPRARPGAVRLLRRPGARERRVGPGLRPLVARRPSRRSGPPDLHPRAARRPLRRGRARSPRLAGDVAPGRPRARADVPLRAGRAGRRRHRARPAARAGRGALRALRVARARPAARAAHRAAAWAPEGPAPAARAHAGGRRGRARAAPTAPGAAARRRHPGARRAARRARPAGRVGPRAGARPPADALPDRGCRGRGAGRRT